MSLPLRALRPSAASVTLTCGPFLAFEGICFCACAMLVGDSCVCVRSVWKRPCRNSGVVLLWLFCESLDDKILLLRSVYTRRLFVSCGEALIRYGPTARPMCVSSGWLFVGVSSVVVASAAFSRRRCLGSCSPCFWAHWVAGPYVLRALVRLVTAVVGGLPDGGGFTLVVAPVKGGRLLLPDVPLSSSTAACTLYLT